MEKKRIKIVRLPNGETTDEGCFFARVDGKCVGENGRAFFETYEEALACGVRFLTKKIEVENGKSKPQL